MSTVRANNLVDASGGNTATINGFFPVEQGGGAGMGTNKVRLGWATPGPTGLLAQIDSTPIGRIVVNPLGTSRASAQLDAPGNPPVYACRAWVSFNGTGTVVINGSGNVTSITDNGVGDYTVNFTTAMPDANYAVSATASHPNNTNYSSTAGLYADAGGAITKLATGVRIGTGSSNTTGATDRVEVSVLIFR